MLSQTIRLGNSFSALHPRQVILFGSRAQSKAPEESDIDLFICLEDDHWLAPLGNSARAGEVLNLFRHRQVSISNNVRGNGSVKPSMNWLFWNTHHLT